uniref:Uncharacterized protein n=1 Tax=Thermosporothrix sp. COM3 TaxID=2490863 RepID=A0A455SEM2_9CHLR|nr:hypothetical protein KTC_05490 [Thermosporothrix sp. COM3]
MIAIDVLAAPFRGLLLAPVRGGMDAPSYSVACFVDSAGNPGIMEGEGCTQSGYACSDNGDVAYHASGRGE